MNGMNRKSRSVARCFRARTRREGCWNYERRAASWANTMPTFPRSTRRRWTKPPFANLKAQAREHLLVWQADMWRLRACMHVDGWTGAIEDDMERFFRRHPSQ